MNSEQTGTSRRAFLGKSACVVSATALASLESLASGNAETHDATPRRQDHPVVPSVADHLAEIVRQRYGQHLTPEQLSSVLRSLENRQQASKRLREVALKNSDEPDTIFFVHQP
jgi:hypothetical protein